MKNLARWGRVGHDLAWPGEAWRAMAWQGKAGCELTRMLGIGQLISGSELCSRAWLGAAGRGKAWPGLAGFGAARPGKARCEANSHIGDRSPVPGSELATRTERQIENANRVRKIGDHTSWRGGLDAT
jgi:hypothetical protein